MKGEANYFYAYDLTGNIIAKFNSSGTWLRAEIYAGRRHLATYSSSANTTYCSFADWLGSERMRTFANGVPCEAILNLPYGDEQVTDALSGGCGDPSPMHFTGKTRDAETGLDYFGARYNSSSLGRFMTPDPMNGYGNNPLSWNHYLYTLDNPVTFTDPTGMLTNHGKKNAPANTAGVSNTSCRMNEHCLQMQSQNKVVHASLNNKNMPLVNAMYRIMQTNKNNYILNIEHKGNISSSQFTRGVFKTAGVESNAGIKGVTIATEASAILGGGIGTAAAVGPEIADSTIGVIHEICFSIQSNAPQICDFIKVAFSNNPPPTPAGAAGLAARIIFKSITQIK